MDLSWPPTSHTPARVATTLLHRLGNLRPRGSPVSRLSVARLPFDTDTKTRDGHEVLSTAQYGRTAMHANQFLWAATALDGYQPRDFKRIGVAYDHDGGD